MTALKIDIDGMVAFMVDLLNTPSPTGYYPEAMDIIEAAFEALEAPGLTMWRTKKGALMALLPGKANDKPRGLTAHTDTLGLMVKEIKPSGRLKVTNLGGIMWSGIEFEGVIVRAQDNRRYRGSVVPNNPGVHVNRKIGSTERNENTMEVRLDEKVESADDVKALGIDVGDFVFLDPRVEVSDNGFIRSRFLDDKACVANIYASVAALTAAGEQPAQDIYMQFSNYEEVGHGGSPGWPSDLDELLVVDMAAMGDGQTSDEYHTTICVKDSGGPYHFLMNNKLRHIAEANAIPYKIDIYPYYASDGTAYWRSGGEARVGLIGPGVDASHSYERTHREALEHTSQLLAQYMLDAE